QDADHGGPLWAIVNHSELSADRLAILELPDGETLAHHRNSRSVPIVRLRDPAAGEQSQIEQTEGVRAYQLVRSQLGLSDEIDPTLVAMAAVGSEETHGTESHQGAGIGEAHRMESSCPLESAKQPGIAPGPLGWGGIAHCQGEHRAG